jgi:hypothetical protein
MRGAQRAAAIMLAHYRRICRRVHAGRARYAACYHWRLITEHTIMAEYESDVTQFLRELLDKNPELKELQKANRATWWDKKLDADQLKRNELSEAPKQPYAYFPLPKN